MRRGHDHSRCFRRAAGVTVALVALVSSPAWAEEAPAVVEARQKFVAGAELVKRAQWAEALVAFEQSASLRPHPVTT